MTGRRVQHLTLAPAIGIATPALGLVTPAPGLATSALGLATPALGLVASALGLVASAAAFVASATGFVASATGFVGSALGLAVLAVAPVAPALAAENGRELYLERCATCHQEDGRGVLGVYPPLADHVGRFVRLPEGRAYLARVLTFGLFGPIRVEDRPYNGLMPPQPALDDGEIAAVLSYVLTELSPAELPAGFTPFSAAEVAASRAPKATFSQMRKEREALLAKLDQQATAAPAIPLITGTPQDYVRQCQGCHGASGMGARGSIPRLRDFVGHFTQVPEGRDYLMRVPGVAFAPLDDARLTAVLNWTLATFSPGAIAPDFRPFTTEEVARGRKNPIVEVKATRARLLAALHARGLIPREDDGLISAAKAGPG